MFNVRAGLRPLRLRKNIAMNSLRKPPPTDVRSWKNPWNPNVDPNRNLTEDTLPCNPVISHGYI